jgi:hypothetical protein
MTIDEALTRFITRAVTLINSMDGIKHQFVDELSELKVAMSDGQDALAQSTEPQAPQPARKAYMIEYHAPAGVAYEPIVTDDPVAFLDRARETAKAGAFKAEDFEPDDNALCIQEIKIVTEEGDPAVHWVDPDALAELHADTILGELEDLLDAIDDAVEARSQLEQEIATIERRAIDATDMLKRLRLKGGAQ